MSELRPAESFYVRYLLLQNFNVHFLHVNLLIEFGWEFGLPQKLRIHSGRHPHENPRTQSDLQVLIGWMYSIYVFRETRRLGALNFEENKFEGRTKVFFTIASKLPIWAASAIWRLSLDAPRVYTAVGLISRDIPITVLTVLHELLHSLRQSGSQCAFRNVSKE